MGWWQQRRIAFRAPVETSAFGNLAASTGWLYAGGEDHEWLGVASTWRSLDGAIVRFYPGDAICVPFAEITADEPEVHQRAMAEADAIARRAFPCFTLAEALSLLHTTKPAAKAPILTAVAASAPEHHRSDVADAVTSGLFAPHRPVRAAALRAVLLTRWPQLARPLVAHALTEPEDDLASCAHALAGGIYRQDCGAHLATAPGPPPPRHSQNTPGAPLEVPADSSGTPQPVTRTTPPPGESPTTSGPLASPREDGNVASPTIPDSFTFITL
ncbi:MULTISPECIES: hypothetical protein [unclassified Streptomyces]|uniref:hypothetical protein n=1 Tax=unclassified Streptomyces TaxID=2593676 RepID=UPI001F0388AB|nr:MULTISPECIES: hypothetical protein [unclassified Streptomyces]MCH0565190.1 hypothetical protein [Streptomyces sp. MUM 2J]MCH0568273.1 hypothetical protein [Streptomyces sp. MUM 136J]